MYRDTLARRAAAGMDRGGGSAQARGDWACASGVRALGRSEAERALRFKQMVEEHMVDAFVYTFRSLRVPKELLR